MNEIKIGNQVWSTENLNVDHYKNGDIIPEVQDPNKWETLTTGAWCYYGNSSENGKKHGKLYNWYAVNDPRGLAPEDWHVPSKEEFGIVVTAVEYDGMCLMEQQKDNVHTINSGFSALLCGHRNDNGSFDNSSNDIYYWSSTEYSPENAHYFNLVFFNSHISIYSCYKKNGFSVRLIKNKTC